MIFFLSDSISEAEIGTTYILKQKLHLLIDEIVFFYFFSEFYCDCLRHWKNVLIHPSEFIWTT